MRLNRTWLAPVMIAVTATGCATGAGGGGGGDQMRNTVFATHRVVQKLDQDLSSSIAGLNENTAELVARLDATDRETRRLASIVEENQVKLDRLQRRLDQLTTTLYRELNLSPPQDMSRQNSGGSDSPSSDVGVQSGDITVQPPRRQGSRREFDEAPVESLQQPLGEIAEAPEPEPEPSVDPYEFYIEARELYANEEFKLALEKFDEYVVRFPGTDNTANAQYWKAHCYFKMEDFRKAIEEFEKVYQNYPNSGKVPIALHNQAVAYSRLGQNQQAVQIFERLISEYPDDAVTVGARDKLRQLQEL